MKILFVILKWISSLWRKNPKHQHKTAENLKSIYYNARHVHDFPETLDEFTVYLLGKPNDEWLAGISCPCGCNELIELVLKGNHPKWEITTSRNGRISIVPSIWRNVGCQSHFFLIDGTIKWCKS